MTEHVILADDLSGACESAAAALLRTTRIRVQLDTAAISAPLPAGQDVARVVAVDLDTRRAAAGDVAAEVERVGRLVDPGTLVVVKVDSILRGRPDVLVAAVRETLGSSGLPVLAVVCPATPALGRTVVGGVVHVDGTPLPLTDLWRAEAQAAPSSVAEALGAPGADVVPLDVVRGPREVLAAALAAAATSGLVVCDAEAEADLDAVVAAAVAVPGVRPVLVGAGGIAGAASRSLPADQAPDASPTPSAESVLVVVGSAAPLLAQEVEALRDSGAHLIDLAVAELVDGRASLSIPGTGVTVVRPEPSAVDPTVSARLVDALAAAVAPAAGSAEALVLTGGETARAVLTRLGTHHLVPLTATGGAVTSRADDGRLVVTRPGSFGGAHSLAAIVSTLTTRAPKEPT
ncbi:four-carbon acid sugar kinase family protein [Oryzobacter telluris]|uniref:four-carbon acid sugar kinase family protein n=1 Tax=Oryzobacter telluris TaxID=3149179 RepID=UPI00370DC403